MFDGPTTHANMSKVISTTNADDVLKWHTLDQHTVLPNRLYDVHDPPSFTTSSLRIEWD